MKYREYSFVVIGFAATSNAMPCPVYAQSELVTKESRALSTTNKNSGVDRSQAWKEVRRLGRGINLGNVFDAPDGEGTWWPGTAKLQFFRDFKSAGFSNVRLPVTWGKHIQDTAPYMVDPEWMARIKEVVGWANDSGLAVVLDTQHEGWFKDDPVKQADRFDALWRQISSSFSRVSDKQLLFEVLNESEPSHISAEQTNAMNLRILKIIRQTNPSRFVIFGAVGDNAERLAKGELEVPNDAYIIATYHCYDPWSFVSASPGAKWGSDQQKSDYLAVMDPIARWSKANSVPIYLGEFGTSRKCDPASRKAYYGFVSSQALARGFSYSVWDDGGDMAIYNRDSGHWDPDIFGVLFGAAPNRK